MNIHLPTTLTFGAGSLDGWRPPGRSLVFLASRSVPASRRQHLVDAWSADGAEVHVLLKPPGEPESDAVDVMAAELPEQVDAVVGLGGGSTLDFAKGLALLARARDGHGGAGAGVGSAQRATDRRIALADFEFGAASISQAAPLYLAPTTAGSGSELTPYAVFNNSRTRRKFTLSHAALQPVEARVDPDLLASLRPEDLLPPALDAMTHCLEALLNRQGSERIHPVAERGLRLAWTQVQPGTTPDLDELARLSVCGGAAIAHNRTGLIHTLSVAFAPYLNVAHGTLNAQLLPFALRHNLPGYGGRLAEIVRSGTGVRVESDEAALGTLEAWMESLVEPLRAGPAVGRESHLVARLMQDKGLPWVSHGLITQESLGTLVSDIIAACS